MPIDFEQLRIAIRHLKRTHKLYKVLKEELTNLGYWKLRARGDPKKGFALKGKGGE